MNCTMRDRNAALRRAHRARERFRPEPRHRGRRDREARHRLGQRFDQQRCRPGESAVGRDRGRDAAGDEPRLGGVGRCEEDVFGGGKRNGHGARQLRASAGYSWTSSIRVPNAVFGCTNATVVPRRPGPGLLVDHPVTVGLDGFERRGAVVDAVADVVQALTLVGEVLRHRRVVADRREQLDVGVGDLEERLLDAVLLDDLPVLDLAAVGRSVVVDRALEVVDGDGDVVDLGQHHGPQSTEKRRIAGPKGLFRKDSFGYPRRHGQPAPHHRAARDAGPRPPAAPAAASGCCGWRARRRRPRSPTPSASRPRSSATTCASSTRTTSSRRRPSSRATVASVGGAPRRRRRSGTRPTSSTRPSGWPR